MCRRKKKQFQEFEKSNSQKLGNFSGKKKRENKTKQNKKNLLVAVIPKIEKTKKNILK